MPDAVRIGIIVVLAVTFAAVMVVATIHLFHETAAISAFKKKCTKQADAVIKKIRLSEYKGGKYKHRDAKATYEFEANGEAITGRDKFSGWYLANSPREGDAVVVSYDPAKPKEVYGYYSAKRFRTTILYLVDFLFIEAVFVVAAVVLILNTNK